MMVLLIVVLVLVVGGAVAVVMGRVGTDSMSGPTETSAFELPDGPLGPQGADGVRFDQSLRGYNMGQVDAVLDRLFDEIAMLRGHADGVNDTRPASAAVGSDTSPSDAAAPSGAASAAAPKPSQAAAQSVDGEASVEASTPDEGVEDLAPVTIPAAPWKTAGVADAATSDDATVTEGMTTRRARRAAADDDRA